MGRACNTTRVESLSSKRRSIPLGCLKGESMYLELDFEPMVHNSSGFVDLET